MTKQEANKRANQLFRKWQREFCNNSEAPNNEYYNKLKSFKEECKSLHSVEGLYEVLTPKNALKMASICSSTRFAEPWQMLIKLQRITNNY